MQVFNLKKIVMMSKRGPVVIIEDDIDDKEIFEQIIRELGIENRLEWFENADLGLRYLNATTDQPFLIFCDVNLPGKNGLDFKERIDSDPRLRKKSIPFVYYSTSASQQDVNQAYTQLTVQGFFKKGSNYAEMKEQIKIIFEYWGRCIHPNIV